jgi:hypothetical protein
VRVDPDHHILHWVLLSLLETAASTPDSKDRHVPLVSHTTARPRQADTSLDSQTMIGRHLESEPAGASRRYENPSRRLRPLNQAPRRLDGRGEVRGCRSLGELGVDVRNLRWCRGALGGCRRGSRLGRRLDRWCAPDAARPDGSPRVPAHITILFPFRFPLEHPRWLASTRSVDGSHRSRRRSRQFFRAPTSPSGRKRAWPRSACPALRSTVSASS